MTYLNTCRDERVKALLKKIYAPVIVGVPPVNAFRDLVQLPNGELRHYGIHRENHETTPIYIASRDCGLSWQECPVPEGCPGACVQSPWSGDWITLIDAHDMKNDLHLHDVPLGLSPGLHVCRSSVGIDGPFEFTPVSALRHAMPRQPLAMRSRKRWIQCCQRKDKEGRNGIVVFRSDDDGRTWEEALLGAIPPHVATGHHRGVRWQNYGCEPTVVELPEGRLWVIIRTSQDNHYEAFSNDGGETWTQPAPSRFYGTITMPTFFRLRDGRILFFWCNTTPLPELDHDQQEELVDWERQGYGEDVFTNRDAFHAAISEDDGRTWIGFRELLLNEHRNDSDFRTSGGNGDCLDKSVHQSQAVELPEGKVLVSVGQHPLCRKLMVFDPAWLYETSRSDDFRYGLGDWSVQQYVKGIVGNFKSVSGHCAYNRRPGAQLVPDPDGEPREVLQIARHPDPRLVEETQGAVWNFPAAQSGELRVDLRLPSGSQGFRLCLMDRWFNPTDTVAHESAIYGVEVNTSGRVAGTPLVLSRDVWHELVIRWTDSHKGEGVLSVDGKTFALPLRTQSLNGICYLHLQSLASTADLSGVLLRSVNAKKDATSTHASRFLSTALLALLALIGCTWPFNASASNDTVRASVQTNAAPPVNGPAPDGKAWEPAWGFWPQAPEFWHPTHRVMVKQVRQGPANVIFIGDSITKGWAGAGKGIWEGRYAPLGAVNIGIGGDTTRQILWRIDNDALDGAKPKLIVLMIGVNNIFTATGSDEDIVRGIGEILKRCQAKCPGSKILLLGVLPLGNTAQNARVATINRMLGGLQGGTVRFLDMTDRYQDAEGRILAELYRSDQVHLVEPGYQVWAEIMQPVLEEMLK